MMTIYTFDGGTWETGARDTVGHKGSMLHAFGTLEKRGLEHTCSLQTEPGELLCGRCWLWFGSHRR